MGWWPEMQFKTGFFFRRQLPFYVMKMLFQMPSPVGGKDKQKLAQQYEKVLKRSVDLNSQFHPFVNWYWIFDNTNTASVNETLNYDDKLTFKTDVYEISWMHYTMAYS